MTIRQCHWQTVSMSSVFEIDGMCVCTTTFSKCIIINRRGLFTIPYVVLILCSPMSIIILYKYTFHYHGTEFPYYNQQIKKIMCRYVYEILMHLGIYYYYYYEQRVAKFDLQTITVSTSRVSIKLDGIFFYTIHSIVYVYNIVPSI